MTLDIDSVHWKLVQEPGTQSVGYRIVPSDDAQMSRHDMLAMLHRMVLTMNKLRGIPTADLERFRPIAFSRFVAQRLADAPQ